MPALYRVECSCRGYSACTRDAHEARQLQNLHRARNADAKRRAGEPSHNVRLSAIVDSTRDESPTMLAVLT